MFVSYVPDLPSMEFQLSPIEIPSKKIERDEQIQKYKRFFIQYLSNLWDTFTRTLAFYVVIIANVPMFTGIRAYDSTGRGQEVTGALKYHNTIWPLVLIWDQSPNLTNAVWGNALTPKNASWRSQCVGFNNLKTLLLILWYIP